MRELGSLSGLSAGYTFRLCRDSAPATVEKMGSREQGMALAIALDISSSLCPCIPDRLVLFSWSVVFVNWNPEQVELHRLAIACRAPLICSTREGCGFVVAVGCRAAA